MSVLEAKLSEEFLSQYRNKQPKWGYDGLGFIVFLRTYARKKEDGTLERWDEVVQRVTEGNFKIELERLKELGKLTQERYERLLREMERFYHIVFNLVATPPGRGLWMSGTEYAERVGDAENNCWGVSMRPQPYFIGEAPKVSFAPCFTFDQAMKGGGVGVNIQRKYVSLIPKVQNRLILNFRIREDHPDLQEVTEKLEKAGYKYVTHYGDNKTYRFFYKKFIFNTVFEVPDSREGWVETLAKVIDAHYEDGLTELTVDVSLVREKDADIKGFGGKASGPAPLVVMLDRVNEILNKRLNDFVTPTEWGDVIQHIGCCVVAGNVRRTALILIGDKDDKEYIQSKNYSIAGNLEASQWRWASNNSIDIDSHTSREVLEQVAYNIYYNGEPGYVNIELARNFGRIIDGFVKDIDGEVEVFNPCGEIPLPNGSPCDLFEVNLPRMHEWISKGIESEDFEREVFWLATRYAYRITFRPYEWEVTRDVVSRHRRIGVGITGITDWVLLKFGQKAILGFDENDSPIFNPEVTATLDRYYQYVREANKEHAEELEANVSIKVTTVKPSGTVSLLMGVSPGQHYHWAKYMIRRVTLSATSVLVPVLMECGYHVEYKITGRDADGNKVYDYNSVIVEFPVKAPTADHPLFQSAGDVPLKEQAALQALLATYWSDNAVSATLSFHKAKPKPVYFADGTQVMDKDGNPVLLIDPRDEKRVIDEITDVLDRYKNTIKSTSLLPYDTDTYDQMPYEIITEERYNEMISKIKGKPWEKIKGAILADDDDLDSSTECVGKSCPIR
jgi:ribonucleoside-triphosphate reductase